MLNNKHTFKRLKSIRKLIAVGLTTILWALSAQAVCAQEPQFMNSDSLVWDTYFFDFMPTNGKHRLEYESQIEEIVEFITEYPDKLYLVTGHIGERGKELCLAKDLSLVRAIYIRNWIKSECKNDSITIVPIGLNCLSPYIKNATNEVEHEQNRRATIEIYNPHRYKGEAAVKVELAIYRALMPVLEYSKLDSFYHELHKLDMNQSKSGKYDQLAAKIRKEREKFRK